MHCKLEPFCFHLVLNSLWATDQHIDEISLLKPPISPPPLILLLFFVFFGRRIWVWTGTTYEVLEWKFRQLVSQ